jgi:hypothetical protein
MNNVKTQEESQRRRFRLERERISTQCVCCGSKDIKSSPAILMPFVAHRVFDWVPIVVDESFGLSTIKNGNAYSICKSLFCADCGFLFLDIRFSNSEMRKLYKDYRGDIYAALRELYEPGYTLRNDNLRAGYEYIEDVEHFLEPHLKFPVTILDWGGDTGNNTPFRNRVDTFDVYDISEPRLVCGARSVSMEEAFSNKYGLIVCSHVLEHIPYPSDLLFDVSRCMAENSILYIEVPLEGIIVNSSADLHLKKKHWHEHINFYSEESIRRLTRNVGLDIIDLRKLNIASGVNSSYVFQIACKLSVHAEAS